MLLASDWADDRSNALETADDDDEDEDEEGPRVDAIGFLTTAFFGLNDFCSNFSRILPYV
jgi:hypothetical protein